MPPDVPDTVLQQLRPDLYPRERRQLLQQGSLEQPAVAVEATAESMPPPAPRPPQQVDQRRQREQRDDQQRRQPLRALERGSGGGAARAAGGEERPRLVGLAAR